MFYLLVKKEITAIIFDTYEENDHFRLFQVQQSLGSYEAFIKKQIVLRHSSGTLKYLVLTDIDQRIIKYAYDHKKELGLADGMSDTSQVTYHFLTHKGSYTDNYIIKGSDLLELYFKLDQLFYDRMKFILRKNIPFLA